MSYIHIILLCGLSMQALSGEFLQSPNLIVKNTNRTGESLINFCKMSEDDTPCSTDGRRCFRGECRDPGRLLVNLTTGHCLLNSDFFSATGRPVMGPCPTSSSPMDRFVPLNALGSTARLGMPYYSKGDGDELVFRYKCLRYLNLNNTNRRTWYLTNTSHPLQFDDCSRIQEIHMEENPEVENFSEDYITSFDWDFYAARDYLPFLNRFLQPYTKWRKLVQVGNAISLEAVYSWVDWNLADRWRWEAPFPFSRMCSIFDDDEENCIGTDIKLEVNFEAESEILVKMNLSLKMMDGVAMNPGIIVSWRSDSIVNLTKFSSNCEQQRMKTDENLTEYKCSLGYLLISDEIRDFPAPIASFTFGVLKFTEKDPEIKIVATTNVSSVTDGNSKPTIVSLPFTKNVSQALETSSANYTDEVSQICPAPSRKSITVPLRLDPAVIIES